MNLANRLLKNPDLRAEYRLPALHWLGNLWFRDRHGKLRWSIDNSLIEALG